MGILYRNLMPESLYLLDNGYVSLMDYRYARRDEGSCRTLCGSPSYFAPEQLRGEAQGSAVDLWQLGVLLFELSDGELPWGANEQDEMTLFRRISAHTAGSLRLPVRVTLSNVPDLWALLNQLLSPDAAQRRGDGPLRAHPFFEPINWPKLVDSELPSPLEDVSLEQFQLRLEDVDWEEADPQPWRPAKGADASWMDDYACNPAADDD